MEDLLELQEKHNKEFQKEKMERLLTSDGRKDFIKEKIGGLVNNILKNKNYQIIFWTTLVYTLLTGVWYVFSNLFTINTVIVIFICVLIIYRKHIIKVKDFLGYKLYKLKIYLSGIFKKKK